MMERKFEKIQVSLIQAVQLSIRKTDVIMNVIVGIAGMKVSNDPDSEKNLKKWKNLSEFPE